MERNMNIRMDGEQYIRYLDRRKVKIPKNMNKALPYFVGSLILLVLAFVVWDEVTTEPTEGVLVKYYQLAPDLATLSWNGVAKWTAIMFLPFIVGAILLSWVIHGVGFYIVRG